MQQVLQLYGFSNCNFTDVLMSVPKEPHYFDVYYGDMQTQEYISRCYGNYKGEKIIGEATPRYLCSPWALQRLAEHYPGAKYIAMLRNPVDRAYSHWWMFYSRAMEHLRFEEAIDFCIEQDAGQEPGQEEWMEHVRRTKAGRSISIRPYLSSGYYGRYLKKFFEWFDRDKLLVIQTEEFNKDRIRGMEEVYQFLGIRNDQEQNVRKHNEAYGTATRPFFRIIKGLGLTRFTQLIPETQRDRIKRLLARAGSKQPVMNPATRKRLAMHYEKHNRDLENLLGRDFNWM
jgi:hypothetical protein